MNKAYFLWIPLTLIYNFSLCWVAIKYNQTCFWKNYIFMVLLSWIPTWSMATYFSKNLIFDTMLYNLIFIVSSPMFMILLGQDKALTTTNYLGIVITIIGLYLIKN